MRIVHAVPGSGGTFYCENCLRDAALVQALRRLGHDVVMVPLYLPLFDDDDVAGDVPVFFGGINVYLQEKFALFRKTPRWLDRLFDTSWMLKRAAKQEGSTSAAELGPMTLSMLRGGEGNQRKELERLVAWLKDHAHPDLLHISNALLLGMAGEIKDALGVPLLCSLQDEDTWLDAMHEPDCSRCWEAMADAARNVDAFVAVSHWYADQMQRRMELPPEKLNVIHLGIDVADAEPAVVERQPPVLGFLSRMGASQGLDRLVDAFLRLKEQPGLRDLQLRATGGITPADHAFIDTLHAKLRQHGVDQDVQFLSDFHKIPRHEFLKSLSVLSVPVPKGEAFGSFILEALAYGVPVVQPRVAAFPEVIEATGGGLLYDPDKEGAYEQTLAELLLDLPRAQALGAQGRATVLEHFSIEAMANKLLALYSRLTDEEES